MFKDKLVNDIFKWVAGSSKVTPEKEKVFRVMIQATLDYLQSKGLLKEDVKKDKMVKLAD
jgi:hypothetical protein